MNKQGYEYLAREVNQIEIDQRVNDGYVNATALCKAAGKRINDYLRLDSTKEFLTELVGYEVFKDEKKESQIFAVALMKLGLRRYLEAREAYSQIENEMHKASDTLRSLGRTLREVGQQSGIIYDGLAEAQHYLSLDKDVYEEAHAKAMSMRERLVLEEQ